MPCFTFEPVMRKRRLHNATRLHERNFSKLLLVIPGIRDIATPLCLQGRGDTRLAVEVLEKSKYTTTFSLQLQQCSSRRWLPSLHMKVRTYHDVHVAEVLAFQGHQHLDPRYTYPNPRMYHRDEKWQLNHFLSDWLDHCLRSRCIFRDKIQPIDA